MTIHPATLRRIRELVDEYFVLPDGALIPRANELLCICESGKDKVHPCAGYGIYISRKNIKHFVESRRQQLSKKHSGAEMLQKMYILVESIGDIILTGTAELQEDGYVICSSIEPIFDKRQYVRVILESKETHFEIRTIHVRTEKRKEIPTR